MSTLPPFENGATLSALSTAPTDTTVGELAGAPAGLITPGRLLALPAAATIRQPLASADAPAAVYEGWTGICAPSDIEITWQRLAIAQFIPARTWACVPEPEFERTLPMKIWLREAIP